MARKEASLPVRLDTESKERLQDIGDNMGLTVSAIVRLLVKSFVQEYGKSGGRIVLPLEWNGMEDGRPVQQRACCAESQTGCCPCRCCPESKGKAPQSLICPADLKYVSGFTL